MTATFDDPRRPASPDELTRFHDRHALLLLAHAPAALRHELDRLVASLDHGDAARIRDDYWRVFRQAVATEAPPSGHLNALLHAAARLRSSLADAEWQGLTRAIEQYAAGAASLSQPLRLIRRYAVRDGQQWLLDQVYLSPDQPPLQ